MLNALAAAALAEAVGLPDAAIVEGIRTFAGVPHRLETVRELDGVKYINDSIATAPERAMAALAADPARARAMGDAARTASERYDIERTVQLTVELYESLLATRPDLQREDAHGRWSRRTEKWAGLLDQLAQLVWPSDGDDNAPRWWPASALAARRERDES